MANTFPKPEVFDDTHPFQATIGHELDAWIRATGCGWEIAYRPKSGEPIWRKRTPHGWRYLVQSRLVERLERHVAYSTSSS